MGAAVAVVAALAAAAQAQVCTECVSDYLSLQSATGDGGKTDLKILTQDSPGVLSAKLVVTMDGDVAVPQTLHYQQLQPDFAPFSGQALQGGERIEVGSCRETVVLPAAAEPGSDIEIVAPLVAGACPLTLETEDPFALLGGWVAHPEVAVRVVRPGTVRLTYLGAKGWVWSPDDAVAAVGTVCASFFAYSAGLPDGVYWIDPSGTDPFATECKISQGGWTLIESLPLATAQSLAGSLSFAMDTPLSGAAGHRLSKARISAVKDVTTALRATCGKGFGAQSAFVEVNHAELDLFAFQSSAGACTSVTGLQIVERDASGALSAQSCSACSALFRQDAGMHLHVDDSTDSCASSVTPSTSSGVDFFGHYADVSNAFGCSLGGLSTTDWWML